MTKEQCLKIQGLNKKQIATIKRWAWEAEKKQIEFKLAGCKTDAEVLEMLNKSVKPNEKEQTPNINLTAFSIEQLENLLNEIPQVIAEKRAEKLSEIEAKIKELEELRAELTKQQTCNVNQG